MKKPIHILVVDDNDDLRFLMCSWLKREGFVPHSARDAKEALRLLVTRPDFDLTVSDLNMPENSGVELYHSLSAANYAGPFILVTANVTIRREDVLQVGIDDFLFKPFSAPVFVDCVRRNLPLEAAVEIKAS